MGFVDVHPWPARFGTGYTQLNDMTYIAVGRAVTITCDSCGVSFKVKVMPTTALPFVPLRWGVLGQTERGQPHSVIAVFRVEHGTAT